MSVSSDRLEMLNRLRTSNDRESVLAATNMFKLLSSAIVSQNARSNALLSEYLEASIACLMRFPADEDIIENLVGTVSTLATAKKECSHAIYSSGMIPQLISALKIFPQNRNITVAVIRTLSELCTSEKRASIIIRLQGGLTGAIELLMQQCYETDQKITRYLFEFLTAMMRKSTVSAAIIAKNRGIYFILLAARRHLLNVRVFQATLGLLDRLCVSKSTATKMAETNGFIQLIFDALGHYKYISKSFMSLMQILKSVAGTHAGFQAIQSAGGFDAILGLIEHNLVKPTTVRIASLLLWQLQRHDFENVMIDDRAYNTQSNCIRVNLPQGEIGQINDDDGYASDVCCSDVDPDDDDDELSDVAKFKSQPYAESSQIASENNCKMEQFMPELWPSKESNSEGIFRRSLVEATTCLEPRSVRDLLSHPDAMMMLHDDGSPGNDNPIVEYQYLPVQSQILATMHSASDRFRIGRKFQSRVVYDRGIKDGYSFGIDSHSVPKSKSFDLNRDCGDMEGFADDIEEHVSCSFQNLRLDGCREQGCSSTKVNPNRISPLFFESRFESGNLFRAIMVSDTEYDLILSTDINTSGRTQWFLFRIQNMKSEVPYKFNIINFEKPESAFNRGMRPVLYSQQAAENGQGKWCRASSTTDIAYFQNYFKKPLCQAKKSKLKNNDADESDYYHTLTFTITFPYSDDTVFLAYFYPFTLTYQLHCLAYLESKPKNTEFLRRQTLCHSIGGNAVDLLTITNFKSSINRIQQRPVIVLTARIHPGEPNSSWVMKGALEFLAGDSDVAHFLRDNAVFKIIPMLNPDGVVEGNNRCSLSGHDQNRQWIDPDEHLSPVVFSVRKLITSVAKERQLLMFCDFHGHSIASNFMLYGSDELGCPPMLKPTNIPLHKEEKNGIKKPIWMSTVGDDFGNKERIFPVMLARRAFNLFSMDQCCFTVQKARAGTSRVVLWRELALAFCFTLEATFNGGTFGPLKGILYNTDHYETMGQEFCRTIADLLSPDQDFVSRAALEIGCEISQESKLKKRNFRRKLTDIKLSKVKPLKRN